MAEVKNTLLVKFFLASVLIGALQQLSLGNQLFCPDQATTKDPSPPTIGDDSSSAEEEEYSGRTYDLRCCVSGNPTPSIEWTKDGKPVSQHFAFPARFELKENNQVLDIRPVLPEDKGIYTCNATNQFGHEVWAIDLYVIEDEPDRQPSVQLRPTEPWRVEEGGSVTLQCVVTGTSTRPVITWLKEHSNKSRYRPREHGTNVTVIPPGNQSSEWISNLTIDHVIAEDAGTYVCRAKNGVGLGPPSEAARELVVVPVNVIQAPNSDSSDTSPFSAAALDWGLVAIVIFAGVVLVGCLWLVRSRIRKSHINHHERCPAMNHGKNGDEECICGEVEFDIFISYNSNDKEWVNNVLREGLSNSYKVCMDSVDFEPGKYITDNIAHNIWVSRKILLVISRNFLKSEWCCYEKQIAQGKVILYRDSLIVIMLENLKTEELPKDLRHYKLEKTYLEWDNDEVKPHFWKRLNDAIGPSVFRVEDVKEEMV